MFFKKQKEEEIKNTLKKENQRPGDIQKKARHVRHNKRAFSLHSAWDFIRAILSILPNRIVIGIRARRRFF